MKLSNAASIRPRIKIGILGAGQVVKEFHLPVLCSMPGIEISWLCDKVVAQAESLSRSYAPRCQVFSRVEDCPDVDVVLMSIPVGLRREPLVHVMERGWSILCEKPFAVSITEHNAILEHAHRKKIEIGVGLIRRYYRGNVLARRLIQSNALGEIKEVWASEGGRLAKTGRMNWYQSDLKAAGGGVLLETGSHLVDQVLSVLDVLSFDIQNCHQQMYKGLDLETRVTGTFETVSQPMIKFTMLLSNVRDVYTGIDIRFSSAILKISVTPDCPLLCTLVGKPLSRLEGMGGVRSVHQAFCMEWRDFLEQCLRPDTHKSIICADTARLSTAFIDRCYRMPPVEQGS